MRLTEQEWFEDNEPTRFLMILKKKLSGRKLRLYACACFQAIQREPLKIKLSADVLQVVSLAERLADGDATEKERKQAAGTAAKWADEVGSFRHVARHLVQKDDYFAALETASEVVEAYVAMESGSRLDEDARARAIYDAIQPWRHELFANPFRRLKFNKSWRASTATALARQMYESRDFSPMPILADALQDAGCDNADILDHCRGPGPHMRGCWVVDLLLGKS